MRTAKRWLITALLFVLFVVLLTITIHFVPQKPTSPSSNNSPILKPDGRRPLILGWTKWFGRDFGEIWADRCPGCQMASDRRLLDYADAVIFHWGDWGRKPKNRWIDLPKSRHSWQRYVYYNHESPCNTPGSLNYKPGFFNLTMSYRRDSDIYKPYGNFVIRNLPENLTRLQQIVSKKTKVAVWIASNCNAPSRRRSIVAKLKAFMPVDIYGNCGQPLSCSASDCNDVLESNYFFYLSFENSICRDCYREILRSDPTCNRPGRFGSIQLRPIRSGQIFCGRRRLQLPEGIGRFPYLSQQQSHRLRDISGVEKNVEIS